MAHIGLTGARKGCSALQFQTLARLLYRRPVGDVLHHGDAIGADAMAHYIAIARGLSVIIHPCNIPAQRAFCPGASLIHDPKPPLDRNRDIVAAVSGLYACPSGPEHVRSGTFATIRHARGRIPIVIVWPDGTVTVERPNV